MRRIEKITGRSDDMLIIRGVNLFPTQIEELILKQPGARTTLHARSHAACASRRTDRACRDGSQLASGSRDARRAAAQKLEHAIKAYVGFVGERAARDADGDRALAGQGKRIVDRRSKE